MATLAQSAALVPVSSLSATRPHDASRDITGQGNTTALTCGLAVRRQVLWGTVHLGRFVHTAEAGGSKPPAPTREPRSGTA
jgi:hypothetical protein